MTFDFTPLLSSAATGVAKAFPGYPPFHFVGGNIDEPSVPVEPLAIAVANVLRQKGHDLAKYGLESGPQGYLPLREFICANLAQQAGMSVSADEVLLTTGSLQALDLVNAALLDAGDVVLVEAENYAGTLTRLAALGVEYVGIAQDAQGMRPDALSATIDQLASAGRKPKYIYTIPTIQNPTGIVMPRSRRSAILDIARRHDIPIFEDDCYSDLVFSGTRPPSFHALDDSGCVIYCATFSKTIAPALRVGYLVAPWPLMSRILPLKTDAGSGALEQMVLAEYLPDNFDAHVAALRPMLQRKADAVCGALDAHFGTSAEFRRPEGGIYVWVTLPDSVDTTRLAQVALEEGVEINPGAQWAVDGAANTRRMRICFGHAQAETLEAGIAKLADICFREFGLPVRSGNVGRD